MDPDEPHRRLQAEAVAADGDAHRDLMAGDATAAAAAFHRASRAYAASWEIAPPGSFGRLVGRIKSAILSGDAAFSAEAAAEVLGAIDGDETAAGSPAAAWAEALAALEAGEEGRLPDALATMESGPPAFGRAAAAVRAIVTGDPAATTTALDAIVEDFAAREDHLTGVAIADTALVLERLAQHRGLPGASPSPLLPHGA